MSKKKSQKRNYNKELQKASIEKWIAKAGEKRKRIKKVQKWVEQANDMLDPPNWWTGISYVAAAWDSGYWEKAYTSFLATILSPRTFVNQEIAKQMKIFRNTFTKEILKKIKVETHRIEVENAETQTLCKTSDGEKGFYDLIIKYKNNKKPAHLVFEFKIFHKVSKDQLENFEKNAKATFGNNYKLLLITLSNELEPGSPWKELTYREILDALIEARAKASLEENEPTDILIRCFMTGILLDLYGVRKYAKEKPKRK